MIILYDVYIYCCKNRRQAMVIPVWLTHSCLMQILLKKCKSRLHQSKPQEKIYVLVLNYTKVK